MNDEQNSMVPGDADDMADALAQISAELGCENNLEDILHAIDALEVAGPSEISERFAARVWAALPSGCGVNVSQVHYALTFAIAKGGPANLARAPAA